MYFFSVDRPADVRITEYEVSNWETFWFRWTYNSSTPGNESTYEGWFRNRYLDCIIINYLHLCCYFLYIFAFTQYTYGAEWPFVCADVPLRNYSEEEEEEDSAKTYVWPDGWLS